MAGLFSKKSKKDKEEKASKAAAAAAAKAGPSSQPSNASLTNHTNAPANPSSILSNNNNTNALTHRDNASANNSITNHSSQLSATTSPPGSSSSMAPSGGSVSISAASEYAAENKQGRMYHLSHQAPSASTSSSHHHHQLQQLHAPVSASSLSTHNSVLTTSGGPWTSSQVMSTQPFPRFSHTASYVQTGSDIYVFGGIVKGSAQKDMHVIDSQTLHCQSLPLGGSDSPHATSGHTAVTLGQYIMYFGGKDAKNKCGDSLYVLHTVRKEWNKPTILGLLPAPRHSHVACVINTVMYVFGGQFNGYYLNDIASFDMKSLNTANPKWNRIEPASELPPARAGHCAATHDGKIYIFGGADEQFFYNDIWCYDPQVNKWEAVPAFGVLPTSRQGHAVAVVDDTMFIYGGMDHEDQLLGDLSAFKFNDRRWLSFPDTIDAASPRTEHAMCAVGDKIYILGGQLEPNAEEDSGSVYILDTTKIRYHDPTSTLGSQRSAYDNENPATSHQDESAQELSSPPPRRVQQFNDNLDQYQQQLQLQQQLIQQQMQQQQHQQQSLPRQSLDGPTDGSAASISRRRTLGKPAGYNSSINQEIEPPVRATQSIDEVRHHQLHGPHAGHHSQHHQQQEYYGPRSSRNQDQNQNQEVGRRRSLSENKGRASIESQTRPVVSAPSTSMTSGSTTTTTGATVGGGGAGRMSMEQSSRGSLRSNLNTGSQQDLQNPVSSGSGSSPTLYSKEVEIRELKQREQWLLAEVAMARKKMGERPISLSPLPHLLPHSRGSGSNSPSSFLNNRDSGTNGNILHLHREELAAFENGADRDSEKHRIIQSLLNVKQELDRSKASIVLQAQATSAKLREAERIRTAALQEAAYLKAKVSALQSGEQQALQTTESARAVDLEKRLTVALGQVNQLQSLVSQNETVLERERHQRVVAETREKEAAQRADDAQMAHTRSLIEVASLHERASVAEASLRECEAKNATSEAGLSSYQQQSTALFSQIAGLKTTVEHQKKSLEKAKLAYSVANDRAEQADRLWTQGRQEMDQTQLEFAAVRADLDRAQRESSHWKTKAQETELLWQKAKNENEAMRTLLEDEMNDASMAPAGGSSPNPANSNGGGSGGGTPTSLGSNIRKHDSIMAITSASRVAELEHELGTLRQLLRESQAAAAQANKDLGETMLRISQLEQAAQVARAEAATAQRRLAASEDKVVSLQDQLAIKEEALEEKAKEQENNEVQLGLLRGVMRENGLLADDLILEALTLGEGGDASAVNSQQPRVTMTSLKAKVHEAEKRVESVEAQLQAVEKIKTLQEQKIVQLEADYQTAVHYVQGSESMVQQLRDQAEAVATEKEALRVTLSDLELVHSQCPALQAAAVTAATESTTLTLNNQMEEEVSDLHRQLHESLGRTMELEQKMEEVSRSLQESEALAESIQQEYRTLKAKHHEHKKQGAAERHEHGQKSVEQGERMESLEKDLEEAMGALQETREELEKSRYEVEQAHRMHQQTGQELDEALAALAKAKAEVEAAASAAASAKEQGESAETAAATAAAAAESEAKLAELSARHEELESTVANAQRTIDSLQEANEDLEEQLRASENKISILLDNFHAGPDSVRNSLASLSMVGGDDLIQRLMEESSALHASYSALPSYRGLASLGGGGAYNANHRLSHGSHRTDRSSADSLANELELLKTPWGQAQINGGAYRSPPMSAVKTSSGLGATSATNAAATASPAPMVTSAHATGETEEMSAAVALAEATTNAGASETGVDEDASLTKADHQKSHSTSSSIGSTVSSPTVSKAGLPNALASPTMMHHQMMDMSTSAQKLEEYERMIEEMAKTRRQYE